MRDDAKGGLGKLITDGEWLVEQQKMRNRANQAHQAAVPESSAVVAS